MIIITHTNTSVHRMNSSALAWNPNPYPSYGNNQQYQRATVQNNPAAAFKKGTVNGDTVFCDQHGFQQKIMDVSRKNGRQYYRCPQHQQKYFLAYCDNPAPQNDMFPNQSDILSKKNDFTPFHAPSNSPLTKEDFLAFEKRIMEAMLSLQQSFEKIVKDQEEVQ